ncbi:tubulin epsilon and delta complex protein 1 isoform X3 [Erinaceus europaeus]|uniref:Tubulin epsilon and delta complex protein 1 isoform X3 n=1 Tax=Erinaceus europaeus TaxID=9365 RepID=A0ABM3WKR6_ERIEU|nr:tubulin epsilon and delta complex protein 1 isoform X3 [Erinaceus europaeus]
MGRRRRGSGAAGVGALPEAIAALSRALPGGPSPETFRRAKFDRPEAVPALRRLLLGLLSSLPEDGAADPDGQARLLRSALCARGYPRGARLPESGAGGSRELLLALAWLLAREPLLERLLARARVQLGDEVTACQWLMGKLQIRWRTLASSQWEHCALLGQIHAYTQGCHSDRELGHLSVPETEALRDPEGGQQLLWRLQCENKRLEAALQWRRCELLFWQWMDSVLVTCPPEEASRPPTPPRLSGLLLSPVSRELELLSRELQTLQEGLREAAGPLRVAWEARAGARGPELEAWQQMVQMAVTRELVALKQTWEHGRAPPQPHGPCRLVQSQAAVPAGLGLQAAELMGVLRSQEACLEEALSQLQAQCQQELARLSGALPGLLWILPSHGRLAPTPSGTR